VRETPKLPWKYSYLFSFLISTQIGTSIVSMKRRISRIPSSTQSHSLLVFLLQAFSIVILEAPSLKVLLLDQVSLVNLWKEIKIIYILGYFPTLIYSNTYLFNNNLDEKLNNNTPNGVTANNNLKYSFMIGNSFSSNVTSTLDLQCLISSLIVTTMLLSQ